MSFLRLALYLPNFLLVAALFAEPRPAVERVRQRAKRKIDHTLHRIGEWPN